MYHQNPNMESLQEIAAQLKQAKDDVTNFKKEHADVFKRRTELNQVVKSLAEELSEKMKECNQTSFEYGGMEFEIKQSTRTVHDMETLKGTMSDETFNEYIENVTVTKSNLAARRQKKRKLGDE